MMECWNIGMMIFEGSMSFVDLPLKRGFDSTPLSHFSGTQYSTIPLFQYFLARTPAQTGLEAVMTPRGYLVPGQAGRANCGAKFNIVGYPG
jgi:hypothetical protein